MSNTMTETRIPILSTQSLPDALIEEAGGRGLQLEALPFIATQAVEDEALKRQIGELLRRRLSAVFTSRHAVEAIGNEGRPEWKIFCIGRMAAERFGEGAIAGTANSARELAEEIIRSGIEKEVYFFCGDQRREELPARLREAGFTVNERIVYRTVQTPHPVDRAFAGIAFFSPSGVESFFSVNRTSPETVLFAIGRTTAGAISAHCRNPVVVGSQPDKEMLIRQMIDHFSKK